MSKIDTHKGIIAWFARNSVAANLLMIILLVGGLFSAFSIQKQVFPAFDIDVINVRVQENPIKMVLQIKMIEKHVLMNYMIILVLDIYL